MDIYESGGLYGYLGNAVVTSSAAGKSVSIRALRTYTKSNILELKSMKEITKSLGDPCRTEEL